MIVLNNVFPPLLAKQVIVVSNIKSQLDIIVPSIFDVEFSIFLYDDLDMLLKELFFLFYPLFLLLHDLWDGNIKIFRMYEKIVVIRVGKNIGLHQI